MQIALVTVGKSERAMLPRGNSARCYYCLSRETLNNLPRRLSALFACVRSVRRIEREKLIRNSVGFKIKKKKNT